MDPYPSSRQDAVVEKTCKRKESISLKNYAPVVQWSTVGVLLTLVLSTRQVNYTHAFAQAELGNKVYLEQPHGFVSVTNKVYNEVRLKNFMDYRKHQEHSSRNFKRDLKKEDSHNQIMITVYS